MREQVNRKSRYRIAFVMLGSSVLFFLVCNICIGSVAISPVDIAKSFLGRPMEETMQGIVWEIRFPRAVAAMVLGGALGLCGYLLQTFFRNPIAGPFILGISSGAKLVVALVMVFGIWKLKRVSSVTLIAAAFVGAFLSMAFVLAMSARVRNMSMLIISGVMIGYICSAITDFVVTFADDADIVNLHNWSKGSFSGMTWSNVFVMVIVVAAAFFCVFFLAKPIGAYQLGEAYARNMGVDISKLRIALVVLSSVLAACIVAYAGPISFVGVATPHLVKGLMKNAQPILMIPACFLGGSAFCLMCDLIARTVFAPTELSISTVTAVFGAPIVLGVMANRRRERD